MKSLLLACSFLLIIVTFSYAQEVSIIPEPANLVKKPGTFTIDPNTKIIFEKGNIDRQAIGTKLSDQIEELTGFQLKVTEDNQKNGVGNIYLSLNKKIDTLGEEGYVLEVNDNGILAKANKRSEERRVGKECRSRWRRER